MWQPQALYIPYIPLLSVMTLPCSRRLLPSTHHPAAGAIHGRLGFQLERSKRWPKTDSLCWMQHGNAHGCILCFKPSSVLRSPPHLCSSTFCSCPLELASRDTEELGHQEDCNGPSNLQRSWGSVCQPVESDSQHPKARPCHATTHNRVIVQGCVCLRYMARPM